jgi:hypothetical protein
MQKMRIAEEPEHHASWTSFCERYTTSHRRELAQHCAAYAHSLHLNTIPA